MRHVLFALSLAAVVSGAPSAQTPAPQQPQPPSPTGYQDTPMQPNGKWHIHDGTRPQPRVVKPGPFVAEAPPADAIVLLGGGTDLGQWQMTEGGGPVTWPIAAGVLSSGKGFIRTRRDDFTDYQLHVEFATPAEVKGNSQGRGNSGVFLNGVFEIQVLDSYDNITYPDGQASAMYGQFPPLVNASRPPGEWQSYDIMFTAPRFNGTTLAKPAVVTVLHNGVLVHNARPFWGPTAHKQIPPYEPSNAKGPIGLQDHGNPVRFRNIWIRPLAGDEDAPAKSAAPEIIGSRVFDWTTFTATPNKTGAVRRVVQAPTATLDELEIHITTLNPGETPHAPHQHPDEELLVVKEGTVESLVNGELKRVGPGSIIFQAANQLHAIRNVGSVPATYHVIKWNSPGMLRIANR